MSVPPILKDLISKTTQWGYDVFPRFNQSRSNSVDQKEGVEGVRTRSNTSQEFWRDFDKQLYSFSQPSLMDGRRDDVGEDNRESDPKVKVHTTESSDNEQQTCDKASLKNIWKFYASEATCHGLNNVANTYRRKWMRYGWLIIVFVMLSTLLATVIELLDDYQQHKTVTRSDVWVQLKPIFPSVTICNMCPYKNLNQTHTNPMYILGAQNTMIRDELPVNFSDPAIRSFMAKSSLEIFDAYSYTKEDMFQYATYEGQYLSIDKDFEITDTPTGRCFTFNGPQYISTYGVRIVNFDGRKSGLRMVLNIKQNMYLSYDGLTAGIRMFITHHPDTPRMEKDGLDVHPGTSTRVALSPEKFQFLPHPFSSYGSEYCLETDKHDLRSKMLDGPFYSRNSCILQCHTLRASQLCSCYSHALYVKNLPPCTFGQLKFCYHVKLQDIKAGLVNVSCDCPRPCSFTRYSSVLSSSQLPSRTALPYLNKMVKTSSLTELRENFLEVRVFLDSMLIRMERHEPQYTLGSIVGFLGGQMGFFMGASVITLAELGEALFFSLICLVHKICNVGRMKTPSVRDGP